MAGRIAGGSSDRDLRIWAAMGLLLIVALALRVVIAARNVWPSVDGVDYMTQARELVRTGHLKYSTFPPGWPLILALPLLVLGLSDPLAPLRAAQTANVALGTLLPWLTFLMVRRRLGERWALGLAALLALLPQDLVLSKGDLSEMSYACALLVVGLLLPDVRGSGAAGEPASPRAGSGNLRLFWTGLVLGYAYLIRPEALLVAAALAAGLFVRGRRVPWGLAIGVLLPVVPYVAFVHAHTGHWGLSGKSVFLSHALQRHPGLQMVPLYLKNAGSFLMMLAGLVGVPIALLAVVGAVLAPGPWLLFLVPLAALPLFDFVMALRYWIPYLPFVLWLAALGAKELLARLRARPTLRARVAPIALLAISVLGLGLAAKDDLLLVYADQEYLPGLRDAGLFLRGRVTRTTGVADYKPFVPFWADCRFVPVTPADSLRTVVGAARADGAEYIIANVYEVHRFLPGLDPLLWSPLPRLYADEVTAVKTFQDAEDPIQSTVIYRINGKGAER